MFKNPLLTISFRLLRLLSRVNSPFSALQMSQIHVISPKHCAKQGLNFKKFNKKLFAAFSTFLLMVLSFILLVWFILHPTKPQFSLKEVEIKQLNLSGPSLLNSSVQLALLSNNPNKKVGIYYDEIQVCASYKSQKITPATSIPPFYQEHEETNYLSASLVGNQQPVAPSFGYDVRHDQRTGKLVLTVKVIGKLRWKVGTWVSGKYRFNVNCVAIIPFGPIPSPSSKQSTQCSTTI